MVIILVCSAILIIAPIFVVQYQRSHAYIQSSAPNPTSNQSGKPASNTCIGPRTILSKLAQIKREAGYIYDGPAFEPGSECYPGRLPERVDVVPQPGSQEKNISIGIGKKESRKPWDPPFPTRAKAAKEPTYRVLPDVWGTSIQENNDKEGKKEIGRKRGPQPSEVSPEEKEEDKFAQTGLMTDTGIPSYDVSLPPPLLSPPFIRSSTPLQPPPHLETEHGQDQRSPVRSTPEPKIMAHQLGKSLSIVQIISLIMASIIFLFAFAILVAHCMSWFVIYKTEARLGEMRKGILRGGDMRVCLCPR